ncbi:hypothetical protein Tco_0666217 [Tanacetum coccineum]
MTKISDVEANLEQYKIDQAAINSEAAAQWALLQETIEKNKVEADRFPGLQFDSQGFPIPWGPNGAFLGLFQTGEPSSHNRMLPGTVLELGRFKAADASSFSILASGALRPQTEPVVIALGLQPWLQGASFKRMTDSEFADKKAKGLCYRCDGKFLPGHRCLERALQLLLVDDEEEEEKEGGMTRNTLHLEDKVVFQGGGDDMNRCLSKGLIAINY